VLWRLEGREAEDLKGDFVAAAVEVAAAATLLGKVKEGLVVPAGDWIGTGMRLGVEREMGDDRGEAKLAGSRALRLGEPAWEMRREGREAGRETVGDVTPVNLAEGAVMRLCALTDV
jgi:hypothetical protein